MESSFNDERRQELLLKIAKLIKDQKDKIVIQNNTHIIPNTVSNTISKNQSTIINKKRTHDNISDTEQQKKCRKMDIIDYHLFDNHDFHYVNQLPKELLHKYTNDLCNIIERKTIYFNNFTTKFIDGNILNNYYNNNSYDKRILRKYIELLFYYNKIMIIGGMFQTHTFSQI
jgi:hypothetical protein